MYRVEKLGESIEGGKFWEHRETYYLVSHGEHHIIKIVRDDRRVGERDWVPSTDVLEFPAILLI